MMLSTLANPSRLAPLQSLGLTSGAQDASFDRITSLARTAISAPVVLVSLVTDQCQVFPSMVGVSEEDLPSRSTPLSYSFCKHVVASGKVLAVDNARVHPLVSDNPAITSLNVIAYLGYPIRSQDGHALGSFCVIDDKPRAWTEREHSLVRDFAELVSTEIRLREELLREKLLLDELRMEKEEATKLKEKAERSAKEALETVKSKSLFLANMSHEIRTPMNGVIGLTELLAETSLDEEQKRLVDTIRMSGESLIELVNDILDYSKFEAGKVSFEYIPVDVAALARNSLRLLEVAGKKKGLSFELEVSPDLPPKVLGDPHRLKQVLLNLISNAVKFTPRGTVKVAIDCRRPRAEGKMEKLLLSVSDTGIGIPQAKIPRLFDAFAQLDLSVTRKYGGTGLGLAICSHIVKGLGGVIDVDSKEGKGTTFTVTLPLELSSEKTGKVGVKATAEEDPIPFPSHWKVLLVEDQPVNQMVASMMLKRLGLSHDMASNGLEALECLQAHPYDLIMVDMQMPVLDGYEATQRIRALDSPVSKIPIIAMTAHALKGAREECLSLGMNDYISKPIGINQLKAAIERVAASSPQKSS